MAELKELADEMLDIVASLRELRGANTSNNSAANVHMHPAGMTRVEWVAVVAVSIVVILSACSVLVIYTKTEAQTEIYAEQRRSDEKSMIAIERENSKLRDDVRWLTDKVSVERTRNDNLSLRITKLEKL